ncbi:carboxylating nicotinate-nucleotide diphosphorylase [Chryseobacterium sp.]|uniref:carboxylating nicotinate-nucleotide diphosphorylase n=1 Tax=Chryseobacterium sp. TaxID=1871047 RepID=UPI00388F8623
MKRPNYATDKVIKQFIKNALEEDIQDGDHSTLSTIPKNLQQSAKLLVKQDCILAGVELAEMIFKTFDKNLKVEIFIKDGKTANIGDVALTVTGSARSILTTERLVLNCMQRMSGIATLTHEWDSRLIGSKTKLLDTRKTTPNFRVCEKWAVAIGGGTNHRYGLYDMIMLKDNHIDYNGSITNAVRMAKEYIKTTKKKLKIEVETRNLAEVKEAIAANVDRIMLDNMDVEMMRKAVQLINGSCESEASGGITRDQLKEIATTGVTYISAGALTHSAENIDLSLKAVKQLELFNE